MQTINYDDIDENIRPMVSLLNCFPGITTMGSCGGHEKPNGTQMPKDSWFVSFKVAHTKGGWESLGLIATIVNYREESELLNLRVFAGHAAKDGRALIFILEGRGDGSLENTSQVLGWIARDSDIPTDAL